MSDEAPREPWFVGTLAALAAGVVLALREAIGHIARRGRAARTGAPVIEAPPLVAVEPKTALPFWELQQNIRAEARRNAESTAEAIARVEAAIDKLADLVQDISTEVRKLKAARRRHDGP